jgi:hypothetical protein
VYGYYKLEFRVLLGSLQKMELAGGSNVRERQPSASSEKYYPQVLTIMGSKWEMTRGCPTFWTVPCFHL